MMNKNILDEIEMFPNEIKKISKELLENIDEGMSDREIKEEFLNSIGEMLGEEE